MPKKDSDEPNFSEESGLEQSTGTSSKTVVDPENLETPNLAAPEAPPPPPAPRPNLDLMRTRRDQLVLRTRELQGIRDAAVAELKKISEELALTAHLFEHPIDPQQNQKSIMHYVKSQAELRAQKAARRAAVLKGLSVEDLAPVSSRLDQSMQRKNMRGSQRPQRAPMPKTAVTNA